MEQVHAIVPIDRAFTDHFAVGRVRLLARNQHAYFKNLLATAYPAAAAAAASAEPHATSIRVS
jgi:hypothetical protein